MPPPLAKAIGLEIKRCMLAKARESASGTVGAAGVHLAQGLCSGLPRGLAQTLARAAGESLGSTWQQSH